MLQSVLSIQQAVKRKYQRIENSSEFNDYKNAKGDQIFPFRTPKRARIKWDALYDNIGYIKCGNITDSDLRARYLEEASARRRIGLLQDTLPHAREVKPEAVDSD